MTTAQIQRLAAAGIQLLPTFELAHHWVVERDGLIALVERRQHGTGQIGAPGLLTDAGFAALVWRGDQAWFCARGFEQPAPAERVDDLRRFAKDLEMALAAE